MEHINYSTIPSLVFAHRFTAKEYRALLPSERNRLEITCVTEGFFTACRKGTPEKVCAGDVVCNFYDLPLTVEADAPHTHHTVCFSSESGFDYLHKIPFIIRSPRIFARCLRLIDGIIRAHALNPQDTLSTAGLFLETAGELLFAGSDADVSPSERLYAEKAKNYLYDHINEPADQRRAAAFLGITPEYLCYVFRKAEGKSYVRFANELKLENISNLMETRGLTLAKASAMYGFSDPNYVSKLYKKYFNTTITRKMKKQGE